MNPDTDIRTKVVLPRELLARIDRLVGQRRRSRFLAELAERELSRLELLSLADHIATGEPLAGLPWGESSESIAAWVAEDRAASAERDEQLSAYAASRSSAAA